LNCPHYGDTFNIVLLRWWSVMRHNWSWATSLLPIKKELNCIVLRQKRSMKEWSKTSCWSSRSEKQLWRNFQKRQVEHHPQTKCHSKSWLLITIARAYCSVDDGMSIRACEHRLWNKMGIVEKVKYLSISTPSPLHPGVHPALLITRWPDVGCCSHSIVIHMCEWHADVVVAQYKVAAWEKP